MIYIETFLKMCNIINVCTYSQKKNDPREIKNHQNTVNVLLLLLLEFQVSF